MFDMDGTLLDSWDALLGAYHDATTEVLGAPPPIEREDIDHLIQLSARDAFPRARGRRSRARHADPGGVRRELPVAQRADQALRRRRGDAARAARARPQARDRHVEVARAPRPRPRADRASASCSTRRSAATRSRSPSPTPRRSVAIMALLGVEPARRAVRGRRRQRRHGRARAPGCRRSGPATASTRAACRAAGPEHWIEAPLAAAGDRGRDGATG